MALCVAASVMLLLYQIHALLLLALSFLRTLCVPASAADSAVGTTLRLTETKGTVTVKTAAGESKSIVKSMRLYSGYTVGTGASSSAYARGIGVAAACVI